MVANDSLRLTKSIKFGNLIHGWISWNRIKIWQIKKEENGAETRPTKSKSHYRSEIWLQESQRGSRLSRWLTPAYDITEWISSALDATRYEGFVGCSWKTCSFSYSFPLFCSLSMLSLVNISWKEVTENGLEWIIHQTCDGFLHANALRRMGIESPCRRILSTPPTYMQCTNRKMSFYPCYVGPTFQRRSVSHNPSYVAPSLIQVTIKFGFASLFSLIPEKE